MSFSNSFLWGVGSSAYQTEGAPAADGKGASIWDAFSHHAGTIFEGDTGDIACDGYRRFEQDIALMAGLGIRAYRFSVSWARVDPEGDGRFNEAGLSYYEAVTDCCLAHGIRPLVTLYHWDLPLALQRLGGWENRTVCRAFARFCGQVARRLGDRVKDYFTINEPQCIVMLGYDRGVHAPGLKLPMERTFACWHNLLLAHGMAADAIRAAASDVRIAPCSTGRLCFPAEGSNPADLCCARTATFEVTDDDWMFTHQMLLDPILLGHYPDVSGPQLARLIDRIPAEEMKLIHTGADRLALNIYNGSPVCADETGAPRYLSHAAGCPRTALKWPVTPQVMEYGPLFLYERYRKPVCITENGISCNDFIYLDGKVHDADRIDFLTRYLEALKRAAVRGVPLEGYFHWSFTDNFEWQSGYGERFGLVYIDYATQRRICKDSANWYSHLIGGESSSHAPASAG